MSEVVTNNPKRRNTGQVCEEETTFFRKRGGKSGMGGGGGGEMFSKTCASAVAESEGTPSGCLRLDMELWDLTKGALSLGRGGNCTETGGARKSLQESKGF